VKPEELLANKSRGLKVFCFGLAIGAVGFLLHWWFNIKAGSIIFVLGWLVGAYGLVVNWKAMYLLSKEKPENLYPRTKQPWER
jgi:hypothetical protein